MIDDDSPQLTRDIAPFGVRMPADLKERVQAAAKANGRSTNAEIVATLLEKYPQPEIEGFHELYLVFQTLHKEDQEQLIFDAMERAGVTKEDVEDGLVPGVRVRRDEPSSD